MSDRLFDMSNRETFFDLDFDLKLKELLYHADEFKKIRALLEEDDSGEMFCRNGLALKTNAYLIMAKVSFPTHWLREIIPEKNKRSYMQRRWKATITDSCYELVFGIEAARDYMPNRPCAHEEFGDPHVYAVGGGCAWHRIQEWRSEVLSSMYLIEKMIRRMCQYIQDNKVK